MIKGGADPLVLFSDLVLNLEVCELIDLLGTVELACLTCGSEAEIRTDVDLVRPVVLVEDSESFLGTTALALLTSGTSGELALHNHSNLLEGVQTCTDIRNIRFDDPLADLGVNDLRECRET